MPKKVVVAMSGGVDSSVAAALLKEQGFEVQGMFMKNWSPDDMQSLSDCPWEQDQADAAAVCEKLGIPFRSVNFEKEYRERVVNYFLQEYEAGRTPNPDVMCNKEIKFDAFLTVAREELGADYIATGHYAQVERGDGGPRLLRGVDPKKDQSYFLWTLGGRQLDSALFPLGAMRKEEVRQIAERFGLPTAAKKDSQGICFIGHIDVKKFLTEHITARPGTVLLLPPWHAGVSFAKRCERAGFIGKHQGSMFHTIGERAGGIIENGLYRHIRERTDVPPVYVLEKDAERNILYVTDVHDDPDFAVTSFSIDGLHITGKSGVETGTDVSQILGRTSVQIRYQQKSLAPVESIRWVDTRVEVVVREPIHAVALGQSAVFYSGERVVGGGIINTTERRGAHGTE